MQIIKLKTSNHQCPDCQCSDINIKNLRTIYIDKEPLLSKNLAKSDLIIIHLSDLQTTINIIKATQQTLHHTPHILTLHPNPNHEQKITAAGSTFFHNCKDSNQVLATIITILTSQQKNQTKILRFKDITLDLNNHTLKRGAETHRLPNKEFQLLKYFINNNNRLIQKQELMENIWDFNSQLTTTTIETHICMLRKKLDSNNTIKRLHTIAYSGYILR
jgi:DNA-binding response OmpR family regulator